MAEKKHVPVDKLQPGPIRREAPPPDLAPVLRWTYRHLGHHYYPTYEQWELGFMRDADPASEIGLWAAMTWATLEFVKRHPGYDTDVVGTAAVAMSLGAEPKGLTPEEIEELQSLMRSIPPELADPESDIYRT